MTVRGIFVGLSTIDVMYSVDRFPQPNSKIAALEQDVFVGGPATNAAITFSLLGGKPTLVTAVGRNTLAKMIREELRSYSVRLVDLNPDFKAAPAISSVSLDKLGNRNVVSANARRIPVPPADVNPGAFDHARVVLIDGHYMEACQAWAKAAQSRGIPVVLDGGSWKEGTEELLKSVDTVICSADFRPPGCRAEGEVFDYLRGCQVKNIAMTRGAEPVLFSFGPSAGSVRVPSVKAIDTMGAGDIFHGAFCYYASMGREFDSALAEAAKLSAESCRFRGPRAWAESKQVNPRRGRLRK
jgi:sugar/nucleoside kinase (ribokinase family)